GIAAVLNGEMGVRDLTWNDVSHLDRNDANVGSKTGLRGLLCLDQRSCGRFLGMCEGIVRALLGIENEASSDAPQKQRRDEEQRRKRSYPEVIPRIERNSLLSLFAAPVIGGGYICVPVR